MNNILKFNIINYLLCLYNYWLLRPIDSKYPNGHYVSIVGPLNDVNTEITSILVEHGLNFNPKFNDSILKNLPIDTPENPWKPDEVILQLFNTK